MKQFFFDKEGRFEFRTFNNIVQDYMLLYDEDLFRFLAKPGDSVYVELYPLTEKEHIDSNAKYSIKSTNKLTQASIEVLKKLTHYNPKIEYYQQINTTQNLDEVYRITNQRELLARNEVDSLLNTSTGEYQTVQVWLNQGVRYRYKNDLLTNIFMKAMDLRGVAKDSMYQLNPYLSKEINEGDKEVYNTDYGYFLHHFELLNRKKISKKLQQLYKEKKFDASNKLSLELIKKTFNPFEAEILESQFYDEILNRPLNSAYLESSIERFLKETKNENFKREIGEKYAVLLNDDTENDLTKKTIKKLPEDIENVIPTIIKNNKGKIIVLDFWATWCSPCLSEFKKYNEFISKFPKEDVSFVFLAYNSPEKLWKKMVSELDFEATHYLLDKNQALVAKKIFEISAIPHHVVLDKQGKTVKNKAASPGRELEDLINSIAKFR